MAKSEAMVASAAAARDGKETSINSGYMFFRHERHVVFRLRLTGTSETATARGVSGKRDESDITVQALVS